MLLCCRFNPELLRHSGSKKNNFPCIGSTQVNILEQGIELTIIY